MNLGRLMTRATLLFAGPCNTRWYKRSFGPRPWSMFARVRGERSLYDSFGDIVLY
jgi:hypothetical protein